MKAQEFERLVTEAIQLLPPDLRQRISNVTVRTQSRPSREQLKRWDIEPGMDVLGFYEGVPLTERTTNYGLVVPDVIYIFREPIEAGCANEEEVRQEIKRTLFHEIAHYFGIDDDRLDEIDAY